MPGKGRTALPKASDNGGGGCDVGAGGEGLVCR